MEKKKKRFDCVEMKRQAQEKLMAEYEARKAEFPTLVGFLNAKAKESPWVSAMMRRARQSKRRQARQPRSAVAQTHT